MEPQPGNWWDVVKHATEQAGPWGALGGLALVVWRIVSASFDSAVAMRERAYIDVLARMERERSEYDRDRERWAAERAALIVELDMHRQADE